jgi:hypothetical protein
MKRGSTTSHPTESFNLVVSRPNFTGTACIDAKLCRDPEIAFSRETRSRTPSVFSSILTPKHVIILRSCSSWALTFECNVYKHSEEGNSKLSCRSTGRIRTQGTKMAEMKLPSLSSPTWRRTRTTSSPWQPKRGLLFEGSLSMAVQMK